MTGSSFIAGSAKDSGDPLTGEAAAAQSLTYWCSNTTEKMIYSADGKGPSLEFTPPHISTRIYFVLNMRIYGFEN